MGKEVVVDDTDGYSTCAFWTAARICSRLRIGAVYLYIILISLCAELLALSALRIWIVHLF